MKNIFDEVGSLDNRCYEEYGLSPDILMENAASAIANFIKSKFEKQSSVLIVAGSGNNGADGITLARILHQDYNVKLYLVNEPKSEMAKLQLQRAKKIGINIVDTLTQSEIIVDAIYGTGLNRELPNNIVDIINELNLHEAYKIACDIPTGYIFKADTTITMGGYKTTMFEDYAKDKVGEIIVADLGVSASVYQNPSDIQLLEFSDMQLPLRKEQNTHKGSFGHLSVISGDKIGASVLAALAATRFGVGLTTIVTKEKNIPYEIMANRELPSNTTALAIGMGLGNEYDKRLLDTNLPIIVDADLFDDEIILEILEKKDIVLTPHPKEFVNMYNKVFEEPITINELQNNRFLYLQKIILKYPNITFLLKGANVLIAQNNQVFVNTFGSNVLSKGGSGDVLSGLIGSLLAQGYTPLQATITSSLAHTKLALMYEGANYSLSPNELIRNIKNLSN